jgi:phage terminase small subunit
MPALANPRHELFAQAVASGLSASAAYRQSGGKGKNADVQAAKLVVNGSIRKRVAELKDAQSQKSELSRDQVREFLVAVIQTPAGELTELLKRLRGSPG